MSPTTEQILRVALGLPADDRDELIDALIAASELGDAPSIDDAWRSVVQRRSAELDAGTVTPTPWEEARLRVHQKLGLDD